MSHFFRSLLGVLASIVFIFLMWETRLARREAFNAIRGGGTIPGDARVATSIHVDRLADWRP
jgi:hypothetical protein